MDLNYAVIIFWVCPQTSGNATNWQVSWPKGPSLFQWILDSSLSCNKLQFHAFPLRLFPFSFLSVASVHFWYHILWIPHFKRSNHAFQVNSSTFFQGFPIPSQPGLRLAAPPGTNALGEHVAFGAASGFKGQRCWRDFFWSSTWSRKL